MGERGVWGGFYVSRRDFLRYSLATGVAVWAGTGLPEGIGEAEARELFRVRRINPRRFPQSVASGDPRPNGIVLWTRVASRAAGAVRVAYEVARESDTDFRRPVLRGVAKTGRGRDYTVKVQLRRSELKPSRKYRYRFIFDGEASRTGHFRTLPAANADVARVRFGYVSCQDYTNGYYHALRFLAQEDVDFVVHLGDYIYETVAEESFQSGQVRPITLPDGGIRNEADTLEDYRFLYRKYRTDPDLQRLHERFAVICIWDDHEFANDAHGVSAPDQGGTTEGDKKNPRRREAANRAWAEYIPAGVPYDPEKGPVEEIRIYRSFAFGSLMELVMTDERLYRDGPPCGNNVQDRYLTPGCGAEEAADRTMLGSPQSGFFLDRVRSPRRWKVWGNEVTFMQFKVLNTYLSTLFPSIRPPAGADGVYVTLDQWDGYQAERRRITRSVRDGDVQNFVTITGDIHSFIAGYHKDDYDRPADGGGNRAVGVEFVCGSVTSSNLTEIATFGRGRAPAPDAGQFTAQVTPSNPHIKFFNSDNHGYNLMEITPGSIVCTMVGLKSDDPTEPNPIRVRDGSKVRKEVLRRFRVRSGEVMLYDETVPGTSVPLPPA